MVHFPTFPPTQLNAYSTVPVLPALASTIRYEFNVGSFARFRDPTVNLTIHDRSDFHNQSHFTIRQRLDAEGQEEAFALIDSNTQHPGNGSKPRPGHGTPFTTALWWITTTEESNYLTQIYTDEVHAPPIHYPGESSVIWQARMLTQDLPLQWVNLDIANIDITDDIAQTYPYDPHDPQSEAYTLGLNFSNEVESRGFYIGPYIEAQYPDEVETSTNITLRNNFRPIPPFVLRLTAQAASGAGLIAKWQADFGELPRQGQIIKFQQDYDWYSPRWAWNGSDAVTGANRDPTTTSTSTSTTNTTNTD